MTSSSQDPFTPDTLVGRYRIVRAIGRGGMGVVYEAVHLGLHKPFALKALHAQGTTLPAARVRFILEAQTAARAEHPNVVATTDAGEHEGVPYLVMQLLTGESLELWLRRVGALDVGVAVDLLLPVLAALDHLHEAGVIHCDLKPTNIFLARDPYGRVVPKVLDFGVARRRVGGRPAGASVLDGLRVGTPAYMSPEQLRGDLDLGPATDQFALGVILYRCLTGHLPFHPDDHSLAARRQRGVAPPRSLVPSLPSHLDSVVRRALHERPDGRFASMRALATELFSYAGSEGRSQWAHAFGKGVTAQTIPIYKPKPAAAPRVTTERTRSIGAPTPEPEVATPPATAPPALVSSDPFAPLSPSSTLAGTVAARPRASVRSRRAMLYGSALSALGVFVAAAVGAAVVRVQQSHHVAGRGAPSRTVVATPTATPVESPARIVSPPPVPPPPALVADRPPRPPSATPLASRPSVVIRARRPAAPPGPAVPPAPPPPPVGPAPDFDNFIIPPGVR